MRQIIYILLFITGFSTQVLAQLSPGDLANPHKDLEGMSKCTQCHDIGNRLSNEKCMACHQEIKYRVDRNAGYHASSEVKGKDCSTCHSDHHGRKFDMVRFDEKNFKHNLTGYELTGGHKNIDCRQCHKPDNISDAGLKKRPETFLGLVQNCNVCHTDRHQKTLGNDCTKCHTTDKFAPATKFNHNKADFALIGKHKNVDCVKCHKEEIKNGAEFQVFKGVAFKNCNSCHDDPHKNNLGNNCKECHSEQSFQSESSLNGFNHSKTLFALKGKHKQTDCRECHKMDATPLTVFQDRKGVLTSDCNTCHKDTHEGRLGTNCAECHNENSFGKVANEGKFNHDRTAFALKGKHVAVDCKKCHVSEKMTDPLPHNTCAACHKDYHEGEFAGNAVIPPDCAKCHTVDAFQESSYSLEDHQKSRFVLEGAHVATPCFACHKPDEKKWKFKGLGQQCVDCHKDVHNGQIDEKWYPGKTCASCHQASSWRDNHFDHSKTKFALSGVHAKQECRACHIPDEAYKYGQFAGLHTDCASCHENVHETQFEENGVTNCKKCHATAESWKIKRFDHNKTRFKLDGKHAKVACEACHKPIAVGEKTYVQYKFESFECVVCHK